MYVGISSTSASSLLKIMFEIPSEFLFLKEIYNNILVAVRENLDILDIGGKWNTSRELTGTSAESDPEWSDSKWTAEIQDTITCLASEVFSNLPIPPKL